MFSLTRHCSILKQMWCFSTSWLILRCFMENDVNSCRWLFMWWSSEVTPSCLQWPSIRGRLCSELENHPKEKLKMGLHCTSTTNCCYPPWAWLSLLRQTTCQLPFHLTTTHEQDASISVLFTWGQQLSLSGPGPFPDTSYLATTASEINEAYSIKLYVSGDGEIWDFPKHTFTPTCNWIRVKLQQLWSNILL